MSEREFGRVEVRGIVSIEDDIPRVQMRVLDEDGNVLNSWAWELHEAWAMAQAINEAVLNAIIAAQFGNVEGLVDWEKLFRSKDHGEQ
jgi:hypothetical protein